MGVTHIRDILPRSRAAVGCDKPFPDQPLPFTPDRFGMLTDLFLQRGRHSSVFVYYAGSDDPRFAGFTRGFDDLQEIAAEELTARKK